MFTSYQRLFLSFDWLALCCCALHYKRCICNKSVSAQKKAHHTSHITTALVSVAAAAVKMAEGATSAGAAAAEDEDSTTRVLRRGDLVKVLERYVQFC